MSHQDSTYKDDHWPIIATTAEAFQQAWDDGDIPALPDYCTQVPAAARKLLLTELIKIDLENRWSMGLRRLIEDYFDDFPELEEDTPAELIFEEFHIRRISGDSLTPDEMVQRFPKRRAQLMSLMAVSPSLAASLQNSPGSQNWKSVECGERLGDFDLLLQLGSGSFARVFLARQQSMQRLVAVKVSEDRGAEGMTLAQLDHNNIVRVFDQQTIPDRRLRLLYMQYVAGGTLQNVIRSIRQLARHEWNGEAFLRVIDQAILDRGESPPAVSQLRSQIAEMSWAQLVCWLGTRLASALAYAHSQRVLHRDLKPANILLTAEGSPRLADFNISFGAGLDGISITDHFGGSLAYMPPEQLLAVDPSDPTDASSVDEQSDIFGLGVVLWEMLTGERPFADPEIQNGTLEQLSQMVNSRREGPRSIHSGIPGLNETPGLQEILLRCLAFEPQHRPHNAMELVRELQLCRDPEAQRLLTPASSGWRRLANWAPILTTMFVTLVPNIVGAVFNLIYNLSEIIEQIPDARDDFWRLQTVINAVAFPLGTVLGIRLIQSVTAIVKSRDNQQMDPELLRQRRRECAELGKRVTILSLTLWLVAAPVYPICLHIMRGHVPAAIYGHFLTSLAICGLIASAYPFLAVSFVAIRCFYPLLMRWDSLEKSDVQPLHLVSQTAWLALILAALVPMIGAALLVLFSRGHHASLLALTIGGASGFAIAVTLFRLLQKDIQILTRTLTANLPHNRP